MFLFSSYYHVLSHEDKSSHYASEIFTVEAIVRDYYIYMYIKSGKHLLVTDYHVKKRGVTWLILSLHYEEWEVNV